MTDLKVMKVIVTLTADQIEVEFPSGEKNRGKIGRGYNPYNMIVDVAHRMEQLVYPTTAVFQKSKNEIL